MGILNLFKKKPKTQSMDTLIPGGREQSPLHDEQTRLQREVNVLKAENEERKKIANLKGNIRNLKREKFGYSPLGIAAKNTGDIFKSGAGNFARGFKTVAKGAPKVIGGLREGVENNVNFDMVGDVSYNPFGNVSKPQGTTPKTILVKVGNNRYAKVKLKGTTKKPKEYDPFGSFGYGNGRDPYNL